MSLGCAVHPQNAKPMVSIPAISPSWAILPGGQAIFFLHYDEDVLPTALDPTMSTMN